MTRVKGIPWDDDSANPHFRPTLLAIRDKIRTMPTVKKDDKAKFLIIYSLLWEIRGNGKLLSTIARDCWSLWFNHSDQQRGVMDYLEWMNSVQAMPDLATIQKSLNSEKEPKIPTTEDEPKKLELTNDQKKSLRLLMFDHHLVIEKGRCACGRKDLMPEEWAKHARVVITIWMMEEGFLGSNP